MLDLRVNGNDYTVDVSPDASLLWVIREVLGLTGTRLGCGMALCGTCTVQLDGEEVRSCITPVSHAIGREVTTIEGFAMARARTERGSWIAEDGIACDYPDGTPILSAAAMLRGAPQPSE